MEGFYRLTECIEKNLLEHSFKKYEIENEFNFKNIIVLRRKTWDSNRAIAIIELSDYQVENIKNLGEFSQKIKRQLGRMIGYKFFLYALGLQIVFYGENIINLSEGIKDYVDKFDNQSVVLQSIHVLDNKESNSVRTWGQFYTGKYQDLIEKSIKEFQI